MLNTMTTPGLRERNKARTRVEVVEAALTLFEDQGYDATTCDDIARAAGIAERTFFRYFETKADVLVAGRGDAAGPDAALNELQNRPQTEAVIDVIRHALAHPARVIESQRDLMMRQFRVIMMTPSLESLRREPFHHFEDPFAEALAARLGQQPGDLAPRWLAAAATSALRISIERWVSSGAETGTLGSLIDEALDLVHRGYDPNP